MKENALGREKINSVRCVTRLRSTTIKEQFGRFTYDKVVVLREVFFV